MWWYIVSLGFLIFGVCLGYLIYTNRKVHLAIDEEGGDDLEEKDTATLAQAVASEMGSIEIGETVGLAEPGWIKKQPRWFKKAKFVGDQSYMISLQIMKQPFTTKKSKAKSKAKKS